MRHQKILSFFFFGWFSCLARCPDHNLRSLWLVNVSRFSGGMRSFKCVDRKSVMSHPESEVNKKIFYAPACRLCLVSAWDETRLKGEFSKKVRHALGHRSFGCLVDFLSFCLGLLSDYKWWFLSSAKRHSMLLIIENYRVEKISILHRFKPFPDLHECLHTL